MKTIEDIIEDIDILLISLNEIKLSPSLLNDYESIYV